MDWLPTVVSVVSAVLAGLALALTWAYHPKPHLLVEWQDSTPRIVDGVFEYPCRVRNVGNAPASDIRLEVDLVKDISSAPWTAEKELGVGAEIQLWVPSMRVKKKHQTIGYSYESIRSSEQPQAPTLIVRWRQSPFFSLERVLKSTMPDNAIFEAVRNEN